MGSVDGLDQTTTSSTEATMSGLKVKQWHCEDVDQAALDADQLRIAQWLRTETIKVLYGGNEKAFDEEMPDFVNRWVDGEAFFPLADVDND